MNYKSFKFLLLSSLVVASVAAESLFRCIWFVEL